MRNTNSILIQENTLLKDTGRKGIVLQPDYDFDRKTHHSYKGATTTLDTINFVRGKCKLLEIRKSTVIQFCLGLDSICSFRQSFSNDTFMDWFPEANLKTQKQ